jgi:acyl-homoserine-lactone acylase
VTTGGPVDVREACPVLERWNLRDDLDSRGALLFRRFASRALTNAVPLLPPPFLFRKPFNVQRPVDTPYGLNTGNPMVKAALGGAVKDLRDAGIPLDARLGDYQFERRGDEKIPIHGGPGGVGVFNAINVPWVPGEGYPDVPQGSSFVYVARVTGGCPESRSILTYSQAAHSSSPHFADQTRLFSRKRWVDMRFCEDEIASDPNLAVTELRGD